MADNRRFAHLLERLRRRCGLIRKQRRIRCGSPARCQQLHDFLELQRRIADQRASLPIIFITGHGDVPMTVQAMKAGALEFLTKPFTPEVLLAAVKSALERSRASLNQEFELQALRDRHQSLSRREQEVMALVVRGQLNKQVGGELGISEITVKAHRGRVMRKMRAKSLPDLVSMAARLGLETAGRG